LSDIIQIAFYPNRDRFWIKITPDSGGDSSPHPQHSEDQMSFKYVVLGAGRQGAAAAYDLALHGDANSVILADLQEDVAQSAAERINRLLDREVARAARVDVTHADSILPVIKGADAVLSAVPYYYNLELTRLSIQAGAHFADLGGNTEIVRRQHALDPQARQAGVSVLPDCGQVPGMGTSLMVYTMSLLDEPLDVYMWDGGIPQNPRPPFSYLLTFNIAGLTNEYAEPGIFLRDGEIVQIEPMTELELVDFPSPINQLEAFVAGGGTSTMPWTYEGKLRTLQNLTLRWPGHYQQLRAYWDLGLWSLEPMEIQGQSILPRDVFHALFEPKVLFPQDRDMVLIRVKVVGSKNGKSATAVLNLVDYYDDATGFTAMERTTGWDAAIVLAMAARGQTPRGAGGLETFVPASLFMQELLRRGFQISENVELM
jgi:lysine 6-dehydrogenase